MIFGYLQYLPIGPQIIDKVQDELDDDMRKIDEASLANFKVTISPAVSPRGIKLQRDVHVD